MFEAIAFTMRNVIEVVSFLFLTITYFPTLQKDDVRTGGYIFEEFYFNLENAFLSKINSGDKTYHVGDTVPVERFGVCGTGV